MSMPAGFWNRGRLVGLLVAITVAILVWLAMSRQMFWADWRTLADELIGEVPSPDGALIARLWCRGNCGLGDVRVLTVSRADRDVGRWSEVVGDLGHIFGDLPGDDAVAELRWAPVLGPGQPLRWRADRSLVVEQPCLSDPDGRALPPAFAQGVAITFRSAPVPTNLGYNDWLIAECAARGSGG